MIIIQASAVMCSVFVKLAPVEDSVLLEPIDFLIVQEMLINHVPKEWICCSAMILN